ncbi:MAG: hypothetical protein U0Z53_29120 [Blastocatellia bacterium]
MPNKVLEVIRQFAPVAATVATIAGVPQADRARQVVEAIISDPHTDNCQALRTLAAEIDQVRREADELRSLIKTMSLQLADQSHLVAALALRQTGPVQG